jgi:hypothetical protein
MQDKSLEMLDGCLEETRPGFIYAKGLSTG